MCIRDSIYIWQNINVSVPCKLKLFPLAHLPCKLHRTHRRSVPGPRPVVEEVVGELVHFVHLVEELVGELVVVVEVGGFVVELVEFVVEVVVEFVVEVVVEFVVEVVVVEEGFASTLGDCPRQRTAGVVGAV
eukprot:1334175-Amorphochlora_amoeboformis.AAC.1